MYLLLELRNCINFIVFDIGFNFIWNCQKSFALQIAVTVILYEIVAIVSATVTSYSGYENLFCHCSVALDSSQSFQSTKTAITCSNHYRFHHLYILIKNDLRK